MVRPVQNRRGFSDCEYVSDVLTSAGSAFGGLRSASPPARSHPCRRWFRYEPGAWYTDQTGRLGNTSLLKVSWRSHGLEKRRVGWKSDFDSSRSSAEKWSRAWRRCAGGTGRPEDRLPWLRRLRGSPKNLEDRPSRAILQTQQLSLELEDLIAELRRAHPDWGPKKLRQLLTSRWVGRLPAGSTVGAVLHRRVDSAEATTGGGEARWRRWAVVMRAAEQLHRLQGARLPERWMYPPPPIHFDGCVQPVPAALPGLLAEKGEG